MSTQDKAQSRNNKRAGWDDHLGNDDAPYAVRLEFACDGLRYGTQPQTLARMYGVKIEDVLARARNPQR